MRSVLALTMDGLLMISMIYPLMPRIKLLEAEALLCSVMADGIALVFALMVIAMVIRFIHALWKRRPGIS